MPGSEYETALVLWVVYSPNVPVPYLSYWKSSAFSDPDASIVTDSPTRTFVSETVQLASAVDFGVGVGVDVDSVTLTVPQAAVSLFSPSLYDQTFTCGS
ncbi:hypothetical protein EAF64_03805 [Halorientalis pallida]|uniref:Uncharacterized protein n=1 Tax=Halorientalis pallida TaxID=2479928 RepID=A0A498L0B7_9EURY|nr:hypothetical protein EAF64_03805 [Halorientalis pallida]